MNQKLCEGGNVDTFVSNKSTCTISSPAGAGGFHGLLLFVK